MPSWRHVGGGERVIVPDGPQLGDYQHAPGWEIEPPRPLTVAPETPPPDELDDVDPSDA